MTAKEKTIKLQRANLLALYIRDVADDLKAGKDPLECAKDIENLSGDYLLNRDLVWKR